MSTTTNSSTRSDSVWPPADSDSAMPVPGTPMLPQVDEPPSAAVGMMGLAVQGAHDTLDGIAQSATPTVGQFEQSVSDAAEVLPATSDQLREAGDRWSESLRRTVRSSPLTTVVAALALGAVLMRIRR